MAFNLLSISIDDLNAYAFLKSLYGGTIVTPNIDRLMAMGTTFENAFAQVAICNASRTSVLTGQDPGLTGVHFNTTPWYEQVDPSATLPAIVRDAGYSTSLIGKVFHEDMPAEVAAAMADHYIEMGHSSLEVGGMHNPHPYEAPEATHSDYVNVDHVIASLNAAGTDPFAMFMGISKPHLGWVVPQKYFDLYPLGEIVLPFSTEGDLSDVPEFVKALLHTEDHAALGGIDGWKKALQGYFASISFADAMVGRVLDTLEANGQFDTTAILLWTDHGYHLGDKDNWHKFTLWEEAARAPVIIALPGSGNDGQRVEQVVELVDIMPTMLDLLGIDAPAGLSGRSLVPFIEQPGTIDDGYAVTTMYGNAAIRTGQYRYIRYEDGSAELYDIVADPNQWTNLATDPAHAEVAEALNATLRADLEADGWHWVDDTAATGGDGADLFVLAPGSAAATGGAGDDTYFVNHSQAGIVESAGGGFDTVYISVNFVLPDHVEALHWTRGRLAKWERPVLIGNDLDNIFWRAWGVVQGRGGNDVINMVQVGLCDGGDGNDTLIGWTQVDELRGGNGDDKAEGRKGADLLSGGAGNDILNGGEDDDDLRGDTGDDILYGSTGLDIMRGGRGNDIFFVHDVGDRAIELADAGTDEVRSAVDYVLRGHVENLRLTAGASNGIGNSLGNLVAGTVADNWLRGMSGDDILSGGAGKDRLSGGDGADRISGGEDRDLLTGGAGNDVFLFNEGSSSSLARAADVIADFSGDGDRIHLGAIDAVPGTDGDQRFAFIGEGAFSGTAGELRYERRAGATWVEADMSGDGVADFVIRVNGDHLLEAADFFL